MLHQVDEDPDALQIGPRRDTLVGPMDTGGRFLRLRHEGTAPQAGVSDLLIVVGVRGPHGHGRQERHTGRWRKDHLPANSVFQQWGPEPPPYNAP